MDCFPRWFAECQRDDALRCLRTQRFDAGLAPGSTPKIVCSRFARRIHAVADCRTETGGVGPLVENHRRC
jgi:hypothetical protein